MFSIFGKDDERKKPKEGGSLLDRLKQSISKTRSQITTKVEDLISVSYTHLTLPTICSV